MNNLLNEITCMDDKHRTFLNEKGETMIKQKDNLKTEKQVIENEKQLISLLERQTQKRFDLKKLGDPKAVLLFLGVRIRQFASKKLTKILRYNKNIFGKKMIVCVYPRWWWRDFGDRFIEHTLENERLKERVTITWQKFQEGENEK